MLRRSGSQRPPRFSPRALDAWSGRSRPSWLPPGWHPEWTQTCPIGRGDDRRRFWRWRGRRRPLPPSSTCRRRTERGHEKEHEQEVRDPLGTQGRVDPALGQRITGGDRLCALVWRKGRRDQTARSGLRLLARRSLQGSARTCGIPVAAMRTADFRGRMTREQRDLLRKLVDAGIRERLERGRNAQALARTRFEARTVVAPPRVRPPDRVATSPTDI